MASRVRPLSAQLPARLDGSANAGERVVRVDEQRDVVRLSVGVGIEGGLLIAEDLDPRMGVSAANRDAVEPSRQDVGRGRRAADVRGARRGDGAVGTLGAPQPELQDGSAAGGLHDAGRLGGDQRLEPDDREQHALDQLSLEERPAHPHQRLVAEDDRALGNRVDVAGETQ